MKIHHVGYIVLNIEKAIAEFETIGWEQETGISFDIDRDMNLCFMKNGDYRIELVSPRSEASVIYNLSKKVGNMPYHICYEVHNLSEELGELRIRGFMPITGIDVASGIGNKKVVFLVNKNIGMIELLEV